MKTSFKVLFLILLACLSLNRERLSGQTLPYGYRTDVLGDSYIARSIRMPDDYEGKVECTVIRPLQQAEGPKAILYVHGYNDYFFQTELCEFFRGKGYRFYAVDLRKYGRSYREHQYPFMVKRLDEYFADIDSAIALMKSEGCGPIALMAHSTGGLITSLYCDARKNSLPVYALALNSPFLDMNLKPSQEKFSIPFVSGLGAVFPKMKVNGGTSTAYAESLLARYHGEWQFDTCWKYPIAPKLTASWIRAIHKGHKRVQKGLDIPCPVWVAHSHQSVYGEVWSEEHQKGDAVLDVNDIERYGKTLGKNVRTATFKNGLHDLALSEKSVREAYYRAAFEFLESALPQTARKGD